MGFLTIDKEFNVDADIPDLSGKVFVVTGGTSGLGKECILHLAKHKPENIFLTARSNKKAEGTVNDIKAVVPDANITVVEMDLGSLATIQKGAKEILGKTNRIDVLLASAGLMNVPPALTTDGYELQFGTNHIGHALLIQHLLPVIRQTSGRIVILTSLGAGITTSAGIHFDQLKTTQANLGSMMSGYYRYGQSKIANILYARELAHRYPDLIAVAVHPGVVKTELVTTRGFGERAFISFSQWIQGAAVRTPEQGAWNSLWASTAAKEKIKSGAWYEPVGKPGRTMKFAQDDELAKKLYDWTEKELAPWMN